MKRKEPLFDLIKSLSGNEKRFFKIYAMRHTANGSNNYVRLFDSIDGLSIYNEDKLRSSIKTESFNKHLSAAKNYLYNLILECLNIYHKDSSIDRQIINYINISKILSEKKLDEQSIRVSEKAKKLSEKFNRFENIITLNSITKNLKIKRDTLAEEELKDYYKEIFLSLEKLKTRLEYNRISDELLLYRRRNGMIKSKKELSLLNIYLNNPFLKDDSRIDSFDANMYFLLSQIQATKIARDEKNGNVFLGKFIKLFEEHPDRIADNINNYIYILNDDRLYKSKEEAIVILKKLASIPDLIGEQSVTQEIEVRIFENYYVCLTDSALKFRDYDFAIPHIKKIEAGLDQYETRITPSFNVVLKFNLACLYFGAGQFKNSLKWCNELINDFPEHREDVQSDIRILYLLIHFELGNRMILPSLMKSTYRYLAKSKRMHKFENIFLKYLGFFLRAESRKEQNLLFIKFRKELIPLLNDKLENQFFYDIDLIGWIDRRIKR